MCIYPYFNFSFCSQKTSYILLIIGLDQGYEPMARVPKVSREKIFLARGIHCFPNSSLTNLSILWIFIYLSLFMQSTGIVYIHIHTHIYSDVF
jgi:hypothetical protein